MKDNNMGMADYTPDEHDKYFGDGNLSDFVRVVGDNRKAMELIENDYDEHCMAIIDEHCMAIILEMEEE